VNAGYGFPAGTQTIYNYDQNSETGVFKVDPVEYSYGKGFNFVSSFGAMYNKYFGAELGIGYLLGSKIETTNNMNTLYATAKNITTDNSKMLFFVPALVFEGGFEKINPYARIGLIVAFPKITSKDEATVTSAFSQTSLKTVEVTKYKMDLGFGVNAALGILFNMSDNFAIFGECNFNSLSITPKSSEITESSIGGVDNLSSMTISEKETVYEKNYVEDPLNPSAENEPSKELKIKIPFSSVGANIGIKISF